MPQRQWKRLLLAGLLLIALLAGYTVYWRHVASLLESGIADWAARERAAGREVQFDAGGITGFPLAFRRDFQDLTLNQSVADGQLTLTAPTVLAVMRPWNLQIITLSAMEPVAVTSRMPNGRNPSLTSQSVLGEIRLLSDGRLQALDLELRAPDYGDGPLRYTAAVAHVKLDLPPLTPRDHREPLLTVGIDLSDLRLPDGLRALTAEPIARTRLSGTIMGPIPLDQPPKDALATWARGGGTVELSQFSFAQKPLDLEGEGTLALGNDQQLLGALTIRAVGLPETIDLLAGEGVIDGRAARTGRLMADGLAKPDDQGRRVVSVALSLQQGHVWLGPIRLARLPQIAW